MRGGKLTVKWLYAEFPRVLFETISVHQRNCTESSHVCVMKSSAVIETEPQRGVDELCGRKTSIIDQQRAGEARLYDDSIPAVQIDHHELRAAPAAQNPLVSKPTGDRPGRSLTQHVGFPDRNLLDAPPTDRAIE